MELLESLRYSLHVIFHPFDGFWDLKYEKRGNLKSAIIILLLLILTVIFSRQNTGFLFNYNDVSRLNVLNESMRVVLPFFLWCVSSWCLTSLMEGEGTFRDIVIATSYSLVPLILINFPLSIISNYITLEEGPLLYTFQAIAILWTAFLLYVGTMVTHQYEPGKTFGTMVLSVIGIMIIIFIGMLFINLILEISGFVDTIYKEIIYRI